jgi:hypothetical protein
MQLQNNAVGVNGPGGARTDVVLGNPDLSQDYVQGQMSLHNGPITLADEQSQWVVWRFGARSCERITLQSGRETLANQIAAERPGKGPSCALVRTLNLIGNPI